MQFTDALTKLLTYSQKYKTVKFGGLTNKEKHF